MNLQTHIFKAQDFPATSNSRSKIFIL